MSSTGTLKALGLNLSPNQLEVPEGSLVEGSNVIIRRDNVIEPRRGFKLWGESFGDITDRLKQLFTYRQRILRHYNSTLQFQNGVNNDGTVNFDNFAGSYSETQTGLRIKSIESNGNFYFTTSDGIKKISAKTGADLSTAAGFITQAGGVKALDMTARLDITQGSQTGFLPADSTVAYRHVWGTFDSNNNLILGTPSQRVEVYNNLGTLLVQDFNALLLALDRIDQTGSLITDGNYVDTLGLSSSASASDVRTNAIALTTKLDNDIVITEDAVDTVTSQRLTTTTAQVVFDTDVSDRIIVGNILVMSSFTNAEFNTRTFTVTNVSTTTVDLTILTGGVFGGTDGAPVADVTGSVRRNKYAEITQPAAPSTPATHQQLQDIQDYLSDIIVELQSEPTGIISSPLQDEFITPLDVTNSANVILDITIPEEITTNYFIQLYRSSISQATGAVVLSDLIANDEMQLVYEAYVTADQITAGELTITDITPDAFRGANLYTNEATGEGIAQANDLPPFAKDINRFKNSIFYANTRTRHRKLLSLIGVVNMLIDYGTGLNSNNFTGADVNTATDTITIASHDYTSGQAVRLTSTGTLPSGISANITYYILNPDTNTFQLSASRESTQPLDITTVGTGTHTIQNVLPTFSIADANTIQTYTFVKGIKEVTEVDTVADVAGSLNGLYFSLYSANDVTLYTVYYQEIGSPDSNPMIANSEAVAVYYNAGDSDQVIAEKTRDTLLASTPDFTVESSTNTITITNVDFGYTTDADAETSGFTVTTTVQGQGEDAALKQILLSDNVSPAIAVDETARSLVRVINKNTSDPTYAYYLSTADTVPGRIFLEARQLSTNPFYVISNSETVGESFSPNIAADNKITNISVANPTVITTSSPHGLTSGNQVVISNSNSTPSIDGVRSVTVLSSTTFSVPVNVTVAGNYAVFSSTTNIEVSENEEKPNRVYYSKLSQPESVPLTNYFDVGAEEKAILRIFPLRDSLFVFKEDGIYRISGESSPFVLGLFDGSCTLLAPDSLGLLDNLIYFWSDQGIVTCSEAGVSSPISRPIDTVLLPIQQYDNFSSSTFGIGYEFDNAYYVWTVQETSDTVATICYRFGTLTSSWTTFDKTNTCGLINDLDKKMYLGAGDTNFIEQERKNFSRLDYSDRELPFTINDGNYFQTQIKFDNITDFQIGDVLVQEQTLTVFEFNMLLKKLDLDPGIDDGDYFSTLQAIGGDNLRDKIVALATKLDADPGVNDTDYLSTIDTKSGSITAISIANPSVITSNGHGLFTGRIITISGSNSTPSINGTYPVTVLNSNQFSIPVNVTTSGSAGSWNTSVFDFDDIKACYNEIIDKLNNDTGVSFSNYSEIDTTTTQEAIVESIDKITKKITFNLELDFVSGPATLFKAIESTITYCPITANDPLNAKHFRQSTIMFENKAFTSATASFSSDLLPSFNNVNFDADGNGIFGYIPFGFGFFGGGSHAVPFRTYIPRNNQRCRFLNVKFTHRIAREMYAIFGMSLSYETYNLGERAYRS